MESIVSWTAPALTMTAAIIVASNLGARVTGWGFIVYTFGAICWIIVAVTTDQQNLLLTNAFLLIVNLFGIWRWLGRQAKYEDGGKAAAEASARKPEPTLFSAASLARLTVKGAGGETLGAVVDAMLRREDQQIAYVVVADGAAGGLGETLRALAPATLTIAEDEVRSTLDRAAFERLPPIKPDRWPAEAPTA